MKGSLYTLCDYGRMIADEGRTNAYAESLKRRVTPASVVVDVGTGTGIFAMLAARLGARKVYAIESSEVIEFAGRAAAQSGLDGRIQFIRGLSTEVQLPERADVIVSDLHGILPAYERGPLSIMDARDRFLKPDGGLIPRRETLWAALVEAALLHWENVGVLAEGALGIEMAAAGEVAANIWHMIRVRPPELVTTPECWAVLDYEVLQSPDVHGEITWQIAERRTAHGICAWFDWDGVEGVSFSNSPLSGERHLFGQAFFPWPAPLDLHGGDEVFVRLRADAVGSEYIYGWETRVRDVDGRTKAAFQQSDFLGMPMSPDRLRRASTAFTPTLNEDGRIDRMVLNGAASGLSLEQIARQVSAGFPHRFASWTDAKPRISLVVSRYSD
jgi:protein arginine N-methyltransferase 1